MKLHSQALRLFADMASDCSDGMHPQSVEAECELSIRPEAEQAVMLMSALQSKRQNSGVGLD